MSAVHEQLFRTWVRQQVELEQLRHDLDRRRVAEAQARASRPSRAT